MKFGLFYTLQAPRQFGTSHAQVYKETLEQITEAEKLGFDSIWIGEHHFLDDGICPNPLLFANAVAARTDHVKIGTGIMLLPLYDPVHVAEDAAMVDILSNGRLILGVSTGYRPEEFSGFHQNRENRAPRMFEQIEILQEAWKSETFSHEGKYYRYQNLSVHPKPVQQPHPPIWIGASGPWVLKQAGRRGLNLISSPRHHLTELKSQWSIYRKALAEGGRNIPEVPIIRYGYLAPSQRQAEDEAEDHVLYIERDMYGAWAQWRDLRDDKGRAVTNKSEVTYKTHRERFLIGESNFVINQIEEHKRELDMNDLICWMQLPGFPHRKVLRSMEIFAREIMPQFR